MCSALLRAFPTVICSLSPICQPLFHTPRGEGEDGVEAGPGDSRGAKMARKVVSQGARKVVHWVPMWSQSARPRSGLATEGADLARDDAVSATEGAVSATDGAVSATESAISAKRGWGVTGRGPISPANPRDSQVRSDRTPCAGTFAVTEPQVLPGSRSGNPMYRHLRSRRTPPTGTFAVRKPLGLSRSTPWGASYDLALALAVSLTW